MFLHGFRIKETLNRNGLILMVQIYYFLMKLELLVMVISFYLLAMILKKIEKFDYSAIKSSGGLTKAGLSRLNQSIKAFVYCILGAQINVHSTINGDSGDA